MNELSQYLLLARYHRRMVRSRLRKMLRENKLVLLTTGLLLATYAIMGFYLFGRGLSLVAGFPGIGGFLCDRVIYLVFFLFLMMLTVSAGVTNYIGLIKGTEIPWLLTLPVSHRVIFLWKATESLVFASWSVFFLSAPLLLAFALYRVAPLSFYPVTLGCLLAFVMVAGAAGSTAFLALLRWGNRRLVTAFAILAVAGFVVYAHGVYRDTRSVQHRTLGVLAVDEVLRHTEASVHPLSPSSWLSRTVILWSRELRHEASFYPFVLGSWALMGVLLLCGVGKRWFYPAWNLQQQREAWSAGRRRHRSQGRSLRWNWHHRRMLGLGRPIQAVIRKDLLSFVRDPSQWVQFTLVFGLLLVYALNLRNPGGRGTSGLFWADFIGYVNLAVCALAVSTLTTRFVFPQFSLEGSRLWILGMAPLGLEKVVLQKWIQASAFIGVLSAVLQVLSSAMLGLSGDVAIQHTVAVVLQTLGLCGIAAGLGTIYPNLEETNSAKIVSGFGGTLCLICSFLYILAFVTTLKVCPSRIWAVVAVLGWTLLFGGVPMALAWRRARRFEFRSMLS